MAHKKSEDSSSIWNKSKPVFLEDISTHHNYQPPENNPWSSTKTKNKNQKLNPKKYENPTTVYNWMSVDNVDGYKK